MKKTSAVLLATLLLLVLSMPAHAGMITCVQCGMKSDMGPFTARILDGEKASYFCDIGDLFAYLNKKKQQAGKVEVAEYKTGDWLDARAAFYVHAETKFRSPMGWGIASFKDMKSAGEYGRALDFDAALKAVQ